MKKMNFVQLSNLSKKIKMKLIKNKKAQEGTTMPLAQIVGWIIVIALILIVISWYYLGLGNYITKTIESFFN